MSKMHSAMYSEGYWERGEGSNYVNYGRDEGWALTAALLKLWLPEGARVYEVGAAKGYFIEAAMGLGIDCYGMDISQYAVDQAPDDSVSYRLRVGNAAVDKIQESCGWDAVVSWEFLEHVPFDELGAVLDNMEQAGKPGALQVHRIGCYVGDESDHHHYDDVTHQPPMPRDWWDAQFCIRGWIPDPAIVEAFDQSFAHRDWKGRFFAYRLPGGEVPRDLPTYAEAHPDG